MADKKISYSEFIRRYRALDSKVYKTMQDKVAKLVNDGIVEAKDVQKWTASKAKLYQQLDGTLLPKEARPQDYDKAFTYDKFLQVAGDVVNACPDSKDKWFKAFKSRYPQVAGKVDEWAKIQLELHEDIFGTEIHDGDRNYSYIPKTTESSSHAGNSAPREKSQSESTDTSNSNNAPNTSDEQKPKFEDQFATSIVIDNNGLNFRSVVRDASGNVTRNEVVREFDNGNSARSGVYINRAELEKCLRAKLAQSKSKKSSVSVTDLDGNIITVKAKNGKISSHNLDKINKFCAETAMMTLPPEKHKNGSNLRIGTQNSFVFSTDNENESKLHEIKIDQQSRKPFVSYDEETQYFGIGGIDVSPIEFKGKCEAKKCKRHIIKDFFGHRSLNIPKSVKILAVAGGLVAGTAVAGLLAPYIMPALGTLFVSTPAAAQPLIGAVGAGLNIAHGLVSGGAALSTAASTVAITGASSAAAGASASIGTAALAALGGLGVIDATTFGTKRVIERVADRAINRGDREK